MHKLQNRYSESPRVINAKLDACVKRITELMESPENNRVALERLFALETELSEKLNALAK